MHPPTSTPATSKHSGSTSTPQHFELKWTQLYNRCSVELSQFLKNIEFLEEHVPIYGTVEDGAEYRSSVDQLKRKTVQLVTKLNVEVIHLAKLIDRELDLSVEDGNRLMQQMSEVGHPRPLSSQLESPRDHVSGISPEMMEKKRRQVRMSKDFNEAMHRFQAVQKLAALKTKQFVVRARAVSVDKKNRRRISWTLPPVQASVQAVTSAPRLDANLLGQEEESTLLQLQTPPQQQSQPATPPPMKDRNHSLEAQLETLPLDRCLQLIDERQADVKQLENDISKVDKILHSMDRTVVEQTGKLNVLENHASSVDSIEAWKARRQHGAWMLPSVDCELILAFCALILSIVLVICMYSIHRSMVLQSAVRSHHENAVTLNG